MPLTLNQFLLLVIALAVVVAVTFFITLSLQLRKTAREAEETLEEIKSLVKNLNETNQKVQAKIDSVGYILEATKKAAAGFSEVAWVMTAKFIKPSSKYWPFLFPFLRLGWRHLKKKKEEKHGK